MDTGSKSLADAVSVPVYQTPLMITFFSSLLCACSGLSVPAGTLRICVYAPFLGSPESTANCMPFLSGRSIHFNSVNDTISGAGVGCRVAFCVLGSACEVEGFNEPARATVKRLAAASITNLFTVGRPQLKLARCGNSIKNLTKFSMKTQRRRPILRDEAHQRPEKLKEFLVTKKLSNKSNQALWGQQTKCWPSSHRSDYAMRNAMKPAPMARSPASSGITRCMG
jgi:hypothetical protein